MAEYWPTKGDHAARQTRGYYDVRDKFGGSYPAWAASATQRLKSWGFNTAGAWSSETLAQSDILYCKVLRMGWATKPNRLIDIFEPDYEKYANEVARAECQPHATNPNLIGYFLDNELPWYGAKSWKVADDTLLSLYSALPGKAAGRIALIAFLESKFPDWASFRSNFLTTADSWESLKRGGRIRTWSPIGEGVEQNWAGEVAKRFYSVASAAIKRYDANHLLLGSRFAGNAPAEVWQAAANYCDVLSVNFYSKEPLLKRWRAVAALTGKPLLISETSQRAMENNSGDPNTVGAGPTVPKQHDRAVHLNATLGAWVREPYIVGVHWFRYYDQPPGGSTNGENSNYGLVDIRDNPYTELIDAWGKTLSERPSKRDALPPTTVDMSQFDVPRLAKIRPSTTADENLPVAPAWSAQTAEKPQVAMDLAHEASSTLSQAENALVWKINTGKGWASTLTLKDPNLSSNRPAAFLEVSVQASDHVKFHLRIIENNKSTANSAADGEIYVSPLLEGTGTNQKIILDLRNFVVAADSGNQSGNQYLDTDAISGLRIDVPANQGARELRVSEVRWLPSSAAATFPNLR